MENKKDIKISKLMSLVLRHNPEALNLKLDANGWCDVRQLIRGIEAKGYNVNMSVLERIVKEDEKGRYSFNSDGDKIRANQGHSINVNLELKSVKPLDILYHGTAIDSLSSIMKDGILRRNRQYVHLSKDVETAIKVGIRHGKPVVLVINAKKMYEDGLNFYISENGVWLTDFIDKRYILDEKYVVDKG